MFSPDRDAFHQAVCSGANLIPLAQSWPADLETPLTSKTSHYIFLLLVEFKAKPVLLTVSLLRLRIECFDAQVCVGSVA